MSKNPQFSNTIILTATTQASGTGWTTFDSTKCDTLEILNNSGTVLEYRRNASGNSMKIPDAWVSIIDNISNADQISIRRSDLSTTQVSVSAEAKRFTRF